MEKLRDQFARETDPAKQKAIDEPTTALDVTTQAEILRLLRELQERRGTGVLFITHDFGVVAEIAHRVVVMQSGRVVEIGTRDEVLRSPQADYTRKLIASVPSLVPPMRAPTSGAVALATERLSKTYDGAGLFFGSGRVVRAAENRYCGAPRRDRRHRRRIRLRLAELVAKKQVTPKELALTAVAAKEKVDPILKSVVELYPDRIECLDEKTLGNGPFRGVPFLIKDFFGHEKGRRIEFGSRLCEGITVEADTYFADMLRASGVNILGRSAAPEYSMSPTTESVMFGNTSNPWKQATRPLPRAHHGRARQCTPEGRVRRPLRAGARARQGDVPPDVRHPRADRRSADAPARRLTRCRLDRGT